MSRKIVHSPRGRTVRCILFDCGETLWTSVDQAHRLFLEQAAEQRALSLLREHVTAELLEAGDAIVAGNQLHSAIYSQARTKIAQKPDYEPDCALVVNEALHQLGIPTVDRVVAEAIFESSRLPTAASRLLFDDALSTLAALQERGFLLGFVTNRLWGGTPFMEGIQELGLLAYVDPRHMAISADLGVRKPNPAIFLHALNALNVAPEEAVMVGDSLRADIAGAQALHIFAAWKPVSSLFASARTSFPSGTMEPDDDTLINAVIELGNQKYQHTGEPIIPDLVIEHLSDLPDIFAKVGPQ